MAFHEQPAQKRQQKSGANASIWTLTVLFLIAFGIVFALSETGNAAEGQGLLFDSPPQSPLPSPLPAVESVNPNTGVTDKPNQINIYGNHFQPKAVVRIAWESNRQAVRSDDTSAYIQLDTAFIDATHLLAKVPAHIAKGLYGVQVANPNGQNSSILHRSYEAISANPQDTNDLKSRGENLWTTPKTLIAGEAVSIGLTVFRVGGQGGVPPFAVDFYADKIDAEHLIGHGFVPGVSPDSSASTSAVTWTPTTYGEIKLIAVIDPDGQVTESNEDNNVVKRQVNVHYTQQTDTTPPIAQKLLVNGGQDQISSPNVELSVEAFDPEPNATDVAKNYYVELQWASGVGSGGSWIPVKWTGWKPFASQPHAYEMMPNSGLRYLQAWVADGAGNISAKPAIQRVNYVPGTDSLSQGEVRIFRPATLAGQCLQVLVEPAEAGMDPDLYVWAPNHTAGSAPVGYSILPAGQADQVVIQPTQSGVYQIEIVAFTDATYTQSIDILETCPTSRHQIPDASTDKQPRTDPSIPLGEVPVGDETEPETIRQFLSFISLTSREAIQSANTGKKIYLPALNR